MEANELNVEYGYRYRSAAIIPDGSPEPSRSRMSGSTNPARIRVALCRTPGWMTSAAIVWR
jgi:hypothetical protein